MSLWQTIRNAVVRYGQPHTGRAVRVLNPAGVRVDHDTAMTFTACWAASKVITETLGVLAWHVFERQPNGGKRRRDDLQVDHMLRFQANPEMTAQVFRETIAHHVMFWGNGYAEIVRDGGGRPNELWPLLPDRTWPVRRADGTLAYHHRNAGGKTIEYEAQDVLHIKGLGFDGVQGYDVISYMSQPLGVALASERHAQSFFKNGASPSGALLFSDRLGKEGRQNVREAFEETYAGPDNAYKVMVLDGLKDKDGGWKQFSISPEAAQLIQSRKFSVTEVARMFRIPPHMVGDLEKATFSNIEHMGQEFAMYTILPWATRFEQEAQTKLLGRRLARGFTKLNLSTLMRGDLKTRGEFYKIGREWGWLNANDIREFEDMDPIPGLAGTAYIVPLNYQLADKLDEEPEPPPAPAPLVEGEGEEGQEEPQDRPQAAAGLRPVLVSALERITVREQRVMSRKEGGEKWLRGEHARYAIDQLAPVMASALALVGIEADAEDLAAVVVEGYVERAVQMWQGEAPTEAETRTLREAMATDFMAMVMAAGG